MKRYILSSSQPSKYIGGKLHDLPEDYLDNAVAMTERFEVQSDYISAYSDNYIVYQPDEPNWQFDMISDASTLLDYLGNSMAIKEGVDVAAYPDHIDVIAYYGMSRDVAHLYPISDEKASELSDVIDNSDFDYSTTIEMEISQYTYGGASVEQILKSWG